MTLYEIDQNIASLVDPETGEVADFEEFAKLQEEWVKKVENTILYIKNLTAEAKAINDEIVVLTERKQKAEKTADRLESIINQALEGQPFETPRCKVSYRKSAALAVQDETALARWLILQGHKDAVKQTTTVSKKAATDLIKGGVAVPFAEIEEKRSMSIK